MSRSLFPPVKYMKRVFATYVIGTVLMIPVAIVVAYMIAHAIR